MSVQVDSRTVHYVTFCNLHPSTWRMTYHDTADDRDDTSIGFSPLAKALLDSFQEGVVVFDAQGRISILNAAGRAVLTEAGLDPCRREGRPAAGAGGDRRPSFAVARRGHSTWARRSSCRTAKDRRRWPSGRRTPSSGRSRLTPGGSPKPPRRWDFPDDALAAVAGLWSSPRRADEMGPALLHCLSFAALPAEHFSI